MKLQEFYDREINLISDFREWWEDNQKTSPDFPLEMKSAEWDEQFDFFKNNSGGNKA